MFLGTRQEALRVLRLFGEKACVYAGVDWPRFCDCKYGGPDDSPGSEQSGCPELMSIYEVLSAMTDKEWRDTGFLNGHVPVGEVQEILETEG